MLVPILLVIHVFAAAFWYGAAVFLIRLVIPTAQAIGEPSREFMQRLGTRIPAVFAGAGGTSVLSGIALLGVVSNGYRSPFINSPMGLTLCAGAACSLIALGFGVAAGRGVRPRLSGIATVAFLSLTLFAMVIAPYA
jgi:uncharacterized membrane protein